MIHAHWYYLLIGFVVSYVGCKVIEDENGPLAVIIGISILLAANLLIGLGLLALLGWSVA